MTIPIQNIYYLLCYAWDSLDEGQIVSISQDKCKTQIELFARVMEGGVIHLLKRGLDRGYVNEEEDTSRLRGKIDVSTTIKRTLLRRSRVHCVIDSLSYDVIHNQIIKATIHSLIKCKDLDRNLRNRLRSLYRRLHDVSEIDLSAKVFGSVQLYRNNAYYRFLIQVCRLIHDNLLINEKTGDSRFLDFMGNEKQMAAMFEKFVRNFYRKEQATFLVKSEKVTWQDVQSSSEDLEFLPGMKTDVSLDSSTRKIVIDTKYYKKSLQSYFDKETIHSGNLYQMFAYLKNLQYVDSRQIEGVLLYPTVSKSLSMRYCIQGHTIRIETLDLNANWQDIHQRLLGLLTPISSESQC